MDGKDNAPSQLAAWCSGWLLLNLHYHMLYLDGVYNKNAVFHPVKPPTSQDLDKVAQKVAERVSRYLEKAGYLVRDVEADYLDLYSEEEDAMVGIVGASISYRLAFGPNAGKKALTLQTLPSIDDSRLRDEQVSKRAGFSLHAGVACKADQRKKLERLCRYITRPAIAEQRLSLASNGNVIVELKSPYSDGTTHVVLSPLEFIGRLVSLVPKPKANLTRFHGVFSSNSKLRKQIVPEKPVEAGTGCSLVEHKPGFKRYGMYWAQRLKRVFKIEIEKCEKCGGKVKVIASIEEPEVIKKILKHLGLDGATGLHNRSPPTNINELFDQTTTTLI
jgi:hypothetical protein